MITTLDIQDPPLVANRGGGSGFADPTSILPSPDIYVTFAEGMGSNIGQP